MLSYSLIETALTDRAEDCSAIAHCISSLNKEDIVDLMSESGTTLTRTDNLAALNRLEETVVKAVLNGYNVNLPLFNISFSISGVFDGLTDSFDPNRHKFNINLTKGTALRDAEKKVKFEKANAIIPQPQIQEVKDHVSGKVNEIITVKGVVEVRGYNLKIEGDDSNCGLWFVHETGNEEQAVTIVENKPTRIIAMVPNIMLGNTQIKVITQHTGGGNLLKTPRIFVYPKTLTVVV